MKVVTDKSHRDFYFKNGYIEFENLLTELQVQELLTEIESFFCKTLNLRKGQLAQEEIDTFFKIGHDLFRSSENIKKNILSKRFAEIACELNETRTLRIGSDQLYLGNKANSLVAKKSAFGEFLKVNGTLEEKSTFTPVLAGLILCLEPTLIEETHPLLPTEVGSGVFFKKDLPFDLQILNEAATGKFLLITYADNRAVYILNEKDFHTHENKKLGYVFGDRLTDQLHPIVYKI